jgi:hypothetical protein
MKPLPSEVIAGVRRILKETIEPELSSGHAKSRLGEVRAVLAQVDWDDAAFTLVARNRSLAEVLVRIEEWRARDPERVTSIPALDVSLPEDDLMAAHQVAYQALAAAVVALVDPLQDWLAGHPDDAQADVLHRDLLALL